MDVFAVSGLLADSLLPMLLGAGVGGGAYCAAFFLAATASGKSNDSGQPILDLLMTTPFAAAAAGVAHGVVGLSAMTVSVVSAIVAVWLCISICISLPGTKGWRQQR
jgi:hypothetical protein